MGGGLLHLYLNLPLVLLIGRHLWVQGTRMFSLHTSVLGLIVCFAQWGAAISLY